MNRVTIDERKAVRKKAVERNFLDKNVRLTYKGTIFKKCVKVDIGLDTNCMGVKLTLEDNTEILGSRFFDFEVQQ